MDADPTRQERVNAERLVATGVRRLTPDIATLFEGTFSVLHCAIKGEDLYRGVYVTRLFPIRHPNHYITLHYTDARDKDREIGVIEDLEQFPADQRELVRRDLTARYCEQTILRVHDIRSEYGLLFFDVTTQRGRQEFVMPWRGDRAEEYGDKGKVLLDSMDNRYIIPDVDQLPAVDRRRFTSFIYW